jgi:hypothetical protein
MREEMYQCYLLELEDSRDTVKDSFSLVLRLQYRYIFHRLLDLHSVLKIKFLVEKRVIFSLRS